MVDHATAKYLNDNVGGVLSKALAEMAISQPTDGVDFLAQWLRTHAEQEEAKAWRERDEKVLEEERAKTKAAADEKAAKLAQQIAAVQDVDNTYDGLLKKFNDPNTLFQDTFWGELVDTTKRYTGASATYMGTWDEEGLDNGATGPCIRYDYSSQGAEWMTEKVLPKDVGVTHGSLVEKPPEENFKELLLWKPPPPPVKEPPPVAEGEEPPPPEEVPTPSYYPVYVECVTDVDKIHYFDMTRLGSYLSVPLVFPSYYTADAFADAKKFEVDKKAEGAARATAAADAEAAAKAAEEAEAGSEAAIAAREEATKAAEEVPEKELVLTGQSVKMVLCMDTLGTNTAFGTTKIEQILDLCKACGECKSRTELKEVDTQALEAINEEALVATSEDIERIRTEVAASTEEAFNGEKAALGDLGLEDEPKAAQEALLERRYAFLRARSVLVELKDSLMKLTSWVVVPPEVMNVLAATVLLFGYTKEMIYPKRKSTLQWQKLKTLLNDSLITAITKAEVNDQRTGLTAEQKLSYVKGLALPADYDEAKAKEVSPIFEVMFTFIKEACAYRSAHLDTLKADFARRQAAATEAGEPFTESPLGETDDDLAE